MAISKEQYVPVLKWRQGEYQALLRLKENEKELITPLLMIPPREYDFEEQRIKKTAHEHVETFPTRLIKKWGLRLALVDTHESLESEKMNDGTSIVSYIFTELRKSKSLAIPVVNLSRGSFYLNEIKKIISIDNNGASLRIKLEELMSKDLDKNITSLLKAVGVNYPMVDLVIDLGEPESFEPYNIFSNALVSKIKTIKGLSKFRSFVVTGMSLKLSKVKKPGAISNRHEWNLYKQLVVDLKNIRIPSYGDYTIESPAFSNLDMRLMKPSGKIVYTSDNQWFISKGGAFRDDPKQMITHCRAIINSGHYCGETYSHGDQRIKDTYNGKENTGNLGTWKQVGVNHHITKVIDQLSNFHV